MRPQNFFVCRPKFTIFFAQRGRSCSSSNVRARAFQKLHLHYQPCLAARRLEKIREDTPTSPEVIGAHTLNFRPNFNFFLQLFFFWGGDPVLVGVCARQLGSISNACKNLRGQHPLRAKMQSSEKYPLGGSELFCLWTKVHPVLQPNVEGVVVDRFFSRFSTYRSFSEIFAIKVQSCQKLRRNLALLLPSQILGGRPSKNCTHIINLASRHVVWKSFMRLLPLGPKLEVHTLNFKSILNFRDYSFLGDTSPRWCACQTISDACKHLKWQHPIMAEIQFPKSPFQWVQTHIKIYVIS